MFQIKDTVITDALTEKKFSCDLRACKGGCCRYGDTGAPLTAVEAVELELIMPRLRPFLRPEAINAIEKQGSSIMDIGGELSTPLINNEECAYTVLKDDIYMCGIEAAYNAGAVRFRKPLSCHLFPLRVKEYDGFTTVNYEEWSICQPALERGERENVPLYLFLKEALIRAFGEEWYEKLLDTVNENKNSNDNGKY